MTTWSGRAPRLVVFATSLLLTAMMACHRVLVSEGSPEFSLYATPSFEGDSTSDSALYQYARAQMYRLITDSGSLHTDSAGVTGTLDVCVDQGSSNVEYGSMLDGKWRSLGCVIRSGPVSGDYPYLESGLSLIMVRRSAGDWQAGVLGLSTSAKRKMFISAGNTRTTLGSDARRFIEGPRIYICYTCDKKACCPQNAAAVTNPTQAQTDVDHFATIW